jgi:hypothetical protein
VVSCHTHDPAAWPWWKNPGTRSIGGWLGPRDGLDILDKRQNFSACRVSNLGSFSEWQSSSNNYTASAPHYTFVVPQTWSYCSYIHTHKLSGGDSIVDRVTRLHTERSCLFDVMQGGDKSVFPKTSRLAMGPNQAPIQWILVAFT